jgi:ribosomal protein S12 methylthiotransferase accessory factor
MALWKLQDENFRTSTRVNLSSVRDPVCVSLIRRLEECEIVPLVWDVTSDIGVPVMRVLLFDRRAHSQLAAQPVAFGAGCHPEPAAALVRALTEAAQSRVTAISGSRDDFTRQMYRDFSLSPAHLDEYTRLAADPGERDWGSVGGHHMSSIANGIAWVLAQLESNGIRQACAVELSPEGAPLHVVRTLAPGLEGPSSSSMWSPGERARRIAD